jgi:hypothetical protein
MRQVFEMSNTFPNSMYDLLLGGVLTAMLVPVLVQARAKNQDEAYAQRLLTLLLLALTGLTSQAVVAALTLSGPTPVPASTRPKGPGARHGPRAANRCRWRPTTTPGCPQLAGRRPAAACMSRV